MNEQSAVSISPNLIKERVMIDSRGNKITLDNKSIKQAQEELKTKPTQKDE